MQAISDLMVSLTQLTDGAVLSGIRKTAEDPPKISILDVISTITGLETNGSSVVYTRLKEDFPEVATKSSHFKFPGRGQRDTPVTDAHGITEIVMLLLGKAAAHVRRQAATVLVRFLGGDLSMVDQIARNHLQQ